jgi:hypothetical protein
VRFFERISHHDATSGATHDDGARQQTAYDRGDRTLIAVGTKVPVDRPRDVGEP